MGNRAVITDYENTDPESSDKTGIYLHWNGGRDSVEAFLTYCKMQGFRTPETDNYGWARFAQIVGNYFGGGTSLGIGATKFLDCNNYDNGVYLIKDWKIVDRKFHDYPEQSEYGLREMLLDIDSSQPVQYQLGVETIDEKLTEYGL